MQRAGIWTQYLMWLPALLMWCAGAAAADGDSLIFTTGQGSDAIVAIDTTTEGVAGRYRVPGGPGPSLVAGELDRLASVSRKTGAIHLFDIAGGKALGLIEAGFVPSEIRLSGDGRTLAAAGPGKIVLVDLGVPAVKAVVPVEGWPYALVFDRKGEKLLIAQADAGRLDVVDVAQGAVVEAIATGSAGADGPGSGIVHLARTPGGSTAMSIDRAGVATLLDLSKWRIAGRISLPGRHRRIFPTVNSQYFLLPNLGERSISILSTWTYAESERLTLKHDTAPLNTVLADTVLFAFDPSSARVSVFDLDRRKRYADIVLPGTPSATITAPGGLKIYAAYRGAAEAQDSGVAVIDVRRLRVVAQITDLGLSPETLFDSGKLSFCH